MISEDHPLTRYRVIDAPHLGMAINPKIWDLVIDALRAGPANDLKREAAA